MVKPFYEFDLTITEACTLRCSYCIIDFDKKKFSHISDELIDNFCEKVDYLIENKDFLKDFSGVQINFWGGEPTVRPNTLIKLLKKYKENDKVCFFVYTNGYNLDKLFDTFVEFSKLKANNRKKLDIQVSYDGLISHNKYRLDPRGKQTALKVKENIYKLKNLGVDFYVNPTMSFDGFNLISENWNEFYRMYEQLGENWYSPSIDYLSNPDFTQEEIEKLKDTLTTEFKKIAKKEIEHYKKTGDFFCGLLKETNQMCSSGAGLQVINLTGEVYTCHAALYISENNRKDLYLNNLNKTPEDFCKKLLEDYNFFRDKWDILPDECQNCYTTYCRKCNVTKYRNSTKKDFTDRWVDYNNQKHLCEIFRHLTKIRKTFLKLVEESR